MNIDCGKICVPGSWCYKMDEVGRPIFETPYYVGLEPKPTFNPSGQFIKFISRKSFAVDKPIFKSQHKNELSNKKLKYFSNSVVTDTQICNPHRNHDYFTNLNGLYFTDWEYGMGFQKDKNYLAYVSVDPSIPIYKIRPNLPCNQWKTQSLIISLIVPFDVNKNILDCECIKMQCRCNEECVCECKCKKEKGCICECPCTDNCICEICICKKTENGSEISDSDSDNDSDNNSNDSGDNSKSNDDIDNNNIGDNKDRSEINKKCLCVDNKRRQLNIVERNREIEKYKYDCKMIIKNCLCEHGCRCDCYDFDSTCECADECTHDCKCDSECNCDWENTCLCRNNCMCSENVCHCKDCIVCLIRNDPEFIIYNMNNHDEDHDQFDIAIKKWNKFPKTPEDWILSVSHNIIRRLFIKYDPNLKASIQTFLKNKSILLDNHPEILEWL